jgi:hypothetical protein
MWIAVETQTVEVRDPNCIIYNGGKGIPDTDQERKRWKMGSVPLERACEPGACEQGEDAQGQDSRQIGIGSELLPMDFSLCYAWTSLMCCVLSTQS